MLKDAPGPSFSTDHRSSSNYFDIYSIMNIASEPSVSPLMPSVLSNSNSCPMKLKLGEMLGLLALREKIRKKSRERSREIDLDSREGEGL